MIKGVEIIAYFKGLTGISNDTKDFISEVIDSWEKKTALFDEVIEQQNPKAKEVIQAIVSRHITDLDEESGLEEIIEQIGADVNQLSEYVESHVADSTIEYLVGDYGALLLTDAEIEKLNGEDEDEETEVINKELHARARIVWGFAIHFCHCLHMGENAFSSVEAYSLGLVDEIVGMTDQYPSTRILHEWANATESEE